MYGTSRGVLMALALATVVVVPPVLAQQPNGEAVFKASCASCHAQAAPRTPLESPWAARANNGRCAAVWAPAARPSSFAPATDRYGSRSTRFEVQGSGFKVQGCNLER